MDSIVIKKIIFDYFDGNYTSIQRKTIEEWLGQAGNLDVFHQYLDEWEAAHPQCTFDLEKGLQRVNGQINGTVYKIEPDRDNFKKLGYSGLFKWLAAASLVLAFSWLGWQFLTNRISSSQEVALQTIQAPAGNIYEKENLTNKPILIHLPDNSSVILQPKSRLSYVPNEFNKEVRKVFLSGEAFFEVHKDKKVPFYVYANGFITSVLGTSFFINTNGKRSEVVVKTGRVTVFFESDLREHAGNPAKVRGLQLRANERVDLSLKKYTVEKTSLLEPEKLTLPIQSTSFTFDEAPVEKILNDLNKVYNAQIVYDAEAIKSCRLTARLSDEPLLEKIELICAAIEASFKREGDQIIIQSTGCQ
ncbi:FecR family protein [Larkinella bovis]|uniref:FecR family protein n=1 Tax=Larkinella bovis TaxID=683041 RepID=A0ABW0IG17_9BACT